MTFRYLRDPLFLICVGTYAVNRWAIKPQMPDSFFSNHLNNLICIPFCTPIMLFMLRRLGLRADDAPPQVYEIVLPLIVWAAAFELWLPTVALFHGLATADHLDVLYYSAGALIAAVWWHKYYDRDGTGHHGKRQS